MELIGILQSFAYLTIFACVDSVFGARPVDVHVFVAAADDTVRVARALQVVEARLEGVAEHHLLVVTPRGFDGDVHGVREDAVGEPVARPPPGVRGFANREHLLDPFARSRGARGELLADGG